MDDRERWSQMTQVLPDVGEMRSELMNSPILLLHCMHVDNDFCSLFNFQLRLPGQGLLLSRGVHPPL
jgi:hypothetical protein